MNNRSKFLNILIKAENCEIELIKILEQIMPLINKNSYLNNKIDEDLKSELIAFSIDLIKNKKIYKKFLK